MKCALQLTFIIFLTSNMREVIHTDVRTQHADATKIEYSLSLSFFLCAYV